MRSWNGTVTREAFHEIERELSSPAFCGIPLGATLNNCLLVEFRNGHGDWGSGRRWLNRARMVRLFLFPRRAHERFLLPREGICMTWADSSPRLNGILLPVLEALAGERCVVLCGRRFTAPWAATENVAQVTWDRALAYSATDWRAAYRRCGFEWNVRLKALCNQYDLPAGAFEQLALELVIASQRVAGCIGFLNAVQPRVIVTEYDRNDRWSCLVLAARLLRIPTITLIHGVVPHDAVGYAPVLADKAICWGELDRGKLIAAGELPAKIVIGGCPRLSRTLSATSAQGRLRLGLDAQRPVVMFATSPERQRFDYVERFCVAIEKLNHVSGIVWLHPSEKAQDYKRIGQRHPWVRFFENHAATLDEALASADVIVVHGSGVGGDALLKGLPTVVFDFEECPSDHGKDMILRASCPQARTPEELTGHVQRILLDQPVRQQLARAADRFAVEFCGAFGADSAQRIAAVVRETPGLFKSASSIQ